MRSPIEFSKATSWRNGFIHYVTLSVDESEPFVMGDIFYGQTFEEALATLDP